MQNSQSIRKMFLFFFLLSVSLVDHECDYDEISKSLQSDYIDCLIKKVTFAMWSYVQFNRYNEKSHDIFDGDLSKTTQN